MIEAGEHIAVCRLDGALAYLLRRVGKEAWEADHRYRFDLPRAGTPVVYFVGAGDGPVKIGFTEDFPARLKVLRNSSPVPIGVLAVRDGNRALESDYHLLFAASRLHGEWFARTPDLLAEIERLSSPAPAMRMAG